MNCRCQREPPPVAIGVPDIYRVAPSRLPHHRPPFVYQWRARVHVYARTLTRDHASPPRTRGGIASPRHATTERSPARRTSARLVSASPRSSRDRVERSPPSRFAGKVDPLCGGRVAPRRDAGLEDRRVSRQHRALESVPRSMLLRRRML